MEGFTYFEDERKRLLKEAMSFETSKDISSNFRGKMFKLIEQCNLEMIKSKDNFFGLFMVQVEKNIAMNLRWPIETTRTLKGYTMTFDLIEILNLDKKQIVALIKHEIYHIMYGHHERLMAFYGKYNQMSINLAMDVSVNQYISHLPSFSYTLEKVNFLYNLFLEKDQSFEVYVSQIEEALKKYKISGENQDDLGAINIHDSWKNPYILSDENSKDLRKSMALKSLKGDNLPQGLEDIFSLMNIKGEIKWSNYLKRLISTMPKGYKKTITRKDRRQPHRLELRGTLRDRIANIFLVIDISGSISDGEIKDILKEVFAIIKDKNANIILGECDNKVRRVYPVKTLKDIKPRLDKRGGTAFSPVFQYMREKNMRDYLLVYFTDGLGEEELQIKPINYKTLWVLTGKDQDLSLKKSYGKVLRLKKKDDYSDEDRVGIHIARDMIHDLQGKISVLTFDL